MTLAAQPKNGISKLAGGRLSDFNINRYSVYYTTHATPTVTHAVSETRAQEVVQCFTSGTCQSDQELDPMTIEDCCLNNTDGLAFQRIGIEICESCIGMCMPVLN